MASDFIITTGHFLQITMNPPETYPTLIAPIPLMGSSTDMKVLKNAVCLEGDETPQMLLSPQPYISPTYNAIPGMGTVKIKIGDSNKSAKLKDSGKSVLIKGQTFQVEFNVTVPATLITPAGAPVTDSVSKKSGTAMFVSMNTIVKVG